LAVVWIRNVQFNWGLWVLTAPKNINNRLCMGTMIAKGVGHLRGM
jgi:hypothetical protein